HSPGHKKDESSGEHDPGGYPPQYVEPLVIYLVAHDLLIVRHEHDEDEQRGSQQSIDHRRPEEGGNGIDAQKVHKHTDQRSDDDNGIELPGATRFLIQAIIPTKRFGQSIGRRAGENWYSQKSRANEA